MKIFKFLLSVAMVISLIICSATAVYASDIITINDVTFEKYVDKNGVVDESLVTVKVDFTAVTAPQQITLLLTPQNVSEATKNKIIYITQDDTPNDGRYEFVIEKAKVQTATGLTDIDGCPLQLKLGGTKITNAASKTVTFTNPDGYSVSGNVKAFGSASKDVKVELLSGTEVVATTTVTGNSGAYSFGGLEAGTYKMTVSKTAHATREYTITVGKEDVIRDVEIWLYGDATGEGIINNTDVLQINRKIANLSSMFNQAANADYRLKIANITKFTLGDEIINSIDILQIYRKVANMTSIFDGIE